MGRATWGARMAGTRDMGRATWERAHGWDAGLGTRDVGRAHGWDAGHGTSILLRQGYGGQGRSALPLSVIPAQMPPLLAQTVAKGLAALPSRDAPSQR